MKWIATVNLEFLIGIEADTVEEAEALVWNENFDDYPKDMYVDIEPLEE